MNRIELYQKTVDTLFDAYNNGTLQHGNCLDCAVGNICGSDAWSARFVTMIDVKTCEIRRGVASHRKFSQEEIETCISNSGYSEEELKSIEYAFEASIAENYYEFINYSPKRGQYIGLCAVLKVLSEIHEVDQTNHEEVSNKLNCIYEVKKGVLGELVEVS